MPMKSKEFKRRELLNRRKIQDKDLALSKSSQIQNALLTENIWKSATNIALYMPISGEVDTKILLEAAWIDKKTVFLPRCNRQLKGNMDFFICNSYADLELGNYNILEPKSHTILWDNSFDLLILPAVGFDKNGYRLGFGGGYYDRFLSKNTTTFSLGLAFSWQILDNLSPDFWNEWDIKVNAIAYEDGILWI